MCNSKLTHSFHFAHRLDYSTSGIMCLPLNKKYCSEICQAFENRLVDKYYIAILNGHFSEDKKFEEINFAIGEDSRKLESKGMCSTKNKEFCLKPRPSKTLIFYCKNGFYKGTAPISKVIVMPITGRRHQLRVHCCDVSQPIFGDYTYGSDFDKNIDRMYLHAIRMVVPGQLDLRTLDPFNGDEFDEVSVNLDVAFEEINKLRNN